MNILNSKIEIEDINGNTIMCISIDNNGNIIKFENCDVADFTDNRIRLQQIEKEF